MLTRLVLVLALLPACTYGAALKRGDQAAAAGEWTRAHAAYTFAAETKETDDARQGQARSVSGQLDEAEAALKSGNFEVAFARIEAAEDMDAEAPRVAAIRKLAQIELEDVLPDRTSVDDLHEAYAFAALAKRLHPRSWVVEDTLAAIRQRVVDDARAKQEGEDWPAARAAVAVLLEHEPELGTMVRSMDDDIVKEWVTALLAQASKVEKGQPGLAAVLYAVAHEVGGEPEHLALARQHYKDAGEKAKRAVKVQTSGAPRHVAARDTLVEAVKTMPGAVLATGASYDLQASVAASAASCKETSESEKKTKEYVSGTRSVPNPEYAELVEGKKAAEMVDKAASSKLSRIQKAYAMSDEKVGALTAKEKEAAAAHKSTSGALETTESQFATSKEVRKEAVRQVEMWETEEDEAAIAAAKKDLAAAEEIHDEWAAKLKVDQAAADKTQAVLDAVREDLEPEAEALEVLTEQLAKADESAGDAAKELAAVSALLAEAPKTLSEDVMSTHTWDEVSWTLKCTLSTTLTMSPKWSSELDKKKVFEDERSTTDTAWRGFEKAGVKADPKEYPKDKATLIADLEKGALAGLAEPVDAMVAESVSLALSTALKDDGGGATDTLIGLYAGALDRLSANERLAVVDAVKTRHHLGDYGLLDPKYAESTPATPATEPAKAEAKPEAKAGTAKAKEPEAKEPEAKEPEAKKPEPKEPETKEPESEAGPWDSPWK